jgi:hypothetical protein
MAKEPKGKKGVKIEKDDEDDFSEYSQSIQQSSLFLSYKTYQFTTRSASSLVYRLPGWLENFRVNKDTIGFKKTISDLPEIKGKALIVDSPFTGSVERQIKDLGNFHGTIIVCDRALSKILPYCTPDYVVNVDSSYLCMSFFDRPDVREKMDKVKAIFSVTTFPLTIRTWTGERIFFTPRIGDISLEMSALSQTDVLMTGGCVHNTAWVIAYMLGAKFIGLYGIDNSYNSLQQTEYPSVKHKEITVREFGANKKFYADPVYLHYARILFEFIKKTKREVVTVNCTQNGIMYESVARQLGYDDIHILHMPLKEFSEKEFGRVTISG